MESPVLHDPTSSQNATVSGAGPSAREPRFIHAFILLVTSGLGVLVVAIIGPSLPQMQQHFASVPNASYLVPMSMTVPMVMVALLAVFFGMLSDRIGRKRLLVGSALLYSVFGTAPLYLDSLGAIFASRIALGVTEAVLMTMSITLIGDYYTGARRERISALQITVATTSAFVLNGLGGALAEHGWRAPYAVYFISLLLVPLMAYYLWEPVRVSRSGGKATPVAGEPPFRPQLMALIGVLGVLVGIVFLVVPVHLGYLYGYLGVTSPTRIGMGYGINSLGAIAGTLLFGWVLAPRVKVSQQLTVAAIIAAAGFGMMAVAHSFATLSAAAFVNGVGCGILLPAMIVWTMVSSPAHKRGFGNGIFQSCFFFGEFLSPLVVLGLEQSVAGSRPAAVGGIGLLLGVVGLLAVLAPRLRSGTPGALRSAG